MLIPAKRRFGTRVGFFGELVSDCSSLEFLADFCCFGETGFSIFRKGWKYCLMLD